MQDGAVIGSDGYGFVTDVRRTSHKIPQRGIVVIEDDVEIGANTTIDRPAVGETRIGAGTKIDNLVQIAHGVQRRCSTCCSPPRSGSRAARRSAITSCSRGRLASPGTSIIGEGAIAPARRPGSPTRSSAGAFVSGIPAIDNRDWLKSSAVFRRLPELKKQLHDLQLPPRRARGALARVRRVSRPATIRMP